MRSQAIRTSLLVLALVFSQWLNFAHHFSHPAAAASPSHACEFCVHAQGVNGGGLSPSPGLPALVVAHEVPAFFPPEAPALRPAPHQPIRGPPQLSA